MARHVTVYAIAGDRGTILAVAKAHKIPIPFDCGDGECGSCLVEVKHVSPSRTQKCGIALTEKEKSRLRELGKITRQEIEDAEVNDMPPRYRLACQCFIRHEDILVTFEGDPDAKPPLHLSTAAKVYKGGIKPTSTEEFLGYAIKVEEDAATHFEELARDMETRGNVEVARLFGRLAEMSRIHLVQARKRAAAIDVAQYIPPDYVWPDHVTPKRTDVWAGDTSLTRLDALRAALQGQWRGYEFYYAVAGSATDPAVRDMASNFVREQAEHVDILKAWITREEWELKASAPKL
jgi:rubrerythrin/ferredoxin